MPRSTHNISKTRESESLQPILTIQLLGGFGVRASDGAPVLLPTRKTEALLALLALRPGHPHARDKICGLLWPEVQDARARHSLRQTVFSVRRALPAALLVSTSRTLAIEATRIQVDVADIERAAQIDSRAALQQAAALYRGELLDGLAIGEHEFEQWLTFERARLRVLMARNLNRLIELQLQDGDVGEAVQSCAQLLQLDPLNEQTHRTLIRLHVRQGRRSSALQQYRALSRLLREELGTVPEQETQDLVAELERAPVSTLVPRVPASSDVVQRAVVPDPDARQCGSALGRGPELEQLRAAFEAESALLNMVLISGEAGVGKTHLCDSFAAACAVTDARVLRGRCFESEQVLPFSLWVNALRDARVLEATEFARALPALLRQELASLFPELEVEAEASARVRDSLRLFQAVHELIATWKAGAPLLIVLEDLHWADEMSLRLLAFLARQAEQPGLLVGTTRDEEPAQAACFTSVFRELERERQLQRLALSPLSPADTATLAQRLAAQSGLGALSERWVEQVCAISEGNPLVVVESLRALNEGSLAQAVTRLPVPERVRTLIATRIARLSAPARELLSLSAAFGRECEYGLLAAAVADPTQSVRALEELVEARLLQVAGERVYFTHDRVRETIYESLLLPRRQVLHGSAAAALERHYATRIDAVLGPLGYHHSKAGNAQASIACLSRFAVRAWRSHGVVAALAALEQALLDVERLPSEQRAAMTIELLCEIARCLAFLGRMAELVERLAARQAVVDGLARHDLSGPYHFWLGFALNAQGQVKRAERHARLALDHGIACADPLIPGYAHALLAYLCAANGRFAEGSRHGALATELVSSADPFPEAETFAWINLAYNQVSAGQWRSALASCRRAEALAAAVDNARGVALATTAVAFVLACAEQWDEALTQVQTSVALSKEPFTLGLALMVLGTVYLGSARTREAVDVLQLVVDQLKQHDMHAWAGLAMGALAEAQIADRAFDAAEQVAQEALELAQRAGDRVGVGFALRVLGSHALAVGRPDVACRHMHEALAQFEAIDARIYIGGTLLRLAQTAMSAADPSAALRDLQRARSLYAELEHTRGVTRADELLAQLAAG